MTITFRDLEKRLAGIERRVQPTGPCNCRLVTRFHDADCLAAILDKIPWQCGVHGFRELGFFLQTPPQYPITDEDNQFCRCPPHPWRSYRLSSQPPTKERSKAAMQAWQDMPPAPPGNFEEHRARTDVLLEPYWKQKGEWVRKTGRKLPSLEERRRVEAKRYRKRDKK